MREDSDGRQGAGFQVAGSCVTQASERVERQKSWWPLCYLQVAVRRRQSGIVKEALPSQICCSFGTTREELPAGRVLSSADRRFLPAAICYHGPQWEERRFHRVPPCLRRWCPCSNKADRCCTLWWSVRSLHSPRQCAFPKHYHHLGFVSEG